MLEILRGIINHYGNENQIDKAKEEAAELIVALSHYRDGKASKKQVIDELADVYIMTQQLKIIFNCELETNKRIAQKLKRIKKRLKL